MRTLDPIEKDFAKTGVPSFDVGDTVDVHVKILEGDKERVQIFTGIVIGKKHQGLSETFTVRRIVQGEGVERIFPVHSPRVALIDVKKKGKVRRAKLHYLRERVGRGTKVEERIGALTGAAEVPLAKAAATSANEGPKVEAKVEAKPEAKAEAPAKK